MKFAVIPNINKPDAVQYSEIICDELKKYGAQLFMPSECKALVDNDDICFLESTEELTCICDIVIALGGDGTIIRLARFCALADKPILGINFGRLGFVAGMEPDNKEDIKRLITGNYKLEKRSMLQATVENDSGEKTYYALNDIVISRGSRSRMIDLSVNLNGSNMTSYRSDGLIFSTPTGSTAYCLSAGGPVIDPNMNCICMVPICPHSLFSRPVIFDSDSVLSVTCSENDDNSVFLTLDGHENTEITEKDRLVIKTAPIYTKLIKINDRDFYGILNDKLWKR